MTMTDHNPTHPATLARTTDPSTSKTTATLIADRDNKGRDQSRRMVLAVLYEHGPLTLDEITNHCDHHWPSRYTPQRYRTASKHLRQSGHATVLGLVERPNKSCRVIELDITEKGRQEVESWSA